MSGMGLSYSGAILSQSCRDHSPRVSEKSLSRHVHNSAIIIVIISASSQPLAIHKAREHTSLILTITV